MANIEGRISKLEALTGGDKPDEPLIFYLIYGDNKELPDYTPEQLEAAKADFKVRYPNASRTWLVWDGEKFTGGGGA